MSQKYDEQDKILFDTILRQPAELYLSVYSIVITFVASGTCLTHSNCLLQHFPFDPKFSPREETVRIFKEPEYLKNQAPLNSRILARYKSFIIIIIITRVCRRQGSPRLKGE